MTRNLRTIMLALLVAGQLYILSRLTLSWSPGPWVREALGVLLFDAPLWIGLYLLGRGSRR